MPVGTVAAGRRGACGSAHSTNYHRCRLLHGRLWLRGGIAVVSSDGFAYEVRNRVTLCRCGASDNKPFCDGSHAAIKFRDVDADT